MHELSILHIFLILFTIFVSCNFPKTNMKKTINDIDYSQLIFLFSPLILLILKSEHTKPLEHLIILYSYMLSINTLKNKLDNNACESNLTFPFIISICLILIYWRLVKYDQIIFVYIYILIFLLYEFNKKYINFNQIINDLLITHFIFQLTK